MSALSVSIQHDCTSIGKTKGGTSMWQIQALSGLEISSSEGGRFSTRSKAANLLIELLAHADHGRKTRAELANTIFEECKNSRAALSLLLTRLRQRCLQVSSQPLVRSDGSYVWLDETTVECNVWALRRSVASKDQPFNEAAIRSAINFLSKYDAIRPDDYNYCVDHLLRKLALECFQYIHQHRFTIRQTIESSAIVSCIEKALQRGIETSELTTILVDLSATLNERPLAFRVIDCYEEFLDSEIGEEPSPELRKTWQQIIDVSQSSDSFIPRAEHWMGFVRGTRNESLKRVLDLISNGARLITIFGEVGAGKTTFALELFEHLSKQEDVLWLEMERLSQRQAMLILSRFRGRVIVVDHANEKQLNWLQNLSHEIDHYVLVVCAKSRYLMAESKNLVEMRSFDLQSEAERGFAAKVQSALLLRYAASERVRSAEELDRFVELSEGNAMLMELSARLVAKYGYHLTVTRFESGWRCSEKSGQFRHPRVEEMLKGEILHLDSSQWPLLITLTMCENPIPIGILEEMFEDAAFTLRELCNRSIVGVATNGYSVFLPKVVRLICFEVVANEASDAAVHAVLDGCTKIVGAGESKEFVSKLVLELSRLSMKLQSQLRLLKLALFIKENTLGKDVLPELLLPIDFRNLAFYWEGSEGGAVLLLFFCSAYFYKGRYESVLEMIDSAIPSGMLILDRETEGELYNLRGLCLRAIGHHQEAHDWLKKALRVVGGSSGRLVARICFNIGLLLADSGADKAEALSWMERAIDASGGELSVERRLEILHTMALLRNSMVSRDSDLRLEFEDCLAYARSYGLTYQIGWILQSIGCICTSEPSDLEAVAYGLSGLMIQASCAFRDELMKNARSTLVYVGASLFKMGLVDWARDCKVLAERIGRHTIFEGVSEAWDELCGLMQLKLCISSEGHIDSVVLTQFIESMLDCCSLLPGFDAVLDDVVRKAGNQAGAAIKRKRVPISLEKSTRSSSSP